jgi:hypothetical protein
MDMRKYDLLLPDKKPIFFSKKCGNSQVLHHKPDHYTPFINLVPCRRDSKTGL